MVEMRILKSREEWLENRGRIGGSDASAIVGKNPYKTNIELWSEKTGQTVSEDISDKPYVIYGTKAEEHLRALFALDYPQYQICYIENNMFLNDRYPFAHASLDGWLEEKETGRKGILEIKTTNILQSVQWKKWKDRIPDNYYIQILHYLLVTEFDFVVLKAQLKPAGRDTLETRHYKIERTDVKEDITYLEQEERKFWEQVQKRQKPSLWLPEI